jgi:hypothetical protein
MQIPDHPAFLFDHHSIFQSDIWLMDRSSPEALIRSRRSLLSPNEESDFILL